MFRGTHSAVGDYSDVIDASKFRVSTMKGLKRKGAPLGHYGGSGRPLLDYVSARSAIFIPAYTMQLDKLEREGHLQWLADAVSEGKTVVFQDFFTNGEVGNTASPLSHAALLRARVLEIVRRK